MTAGMLADRFGARRVALTGLWLWGACFALLGLAGPQIWQWYAACVLFSVMSQGVTAVIWTTMVVKRFAVQRGLALALSLLGGGLMVAITPMLVVMLNEAVGVRGVFFTIAVAGTLLMLVPTLLLFHEAPAPEPHRHAAGPVTHPGASAAEALRSAVYWKLAGGLLLVSACLGTFVVHIQPLLMDTGMSAREAASIAFFIGPAMIGGRLLTGVLFDHVDARAVAAGAFMLPALACLLLLSLNDSYLMAALAGIVIGLGMGAEIDVMAYLTSRYFGLKRYGLLFGTLISIYGIGVGAGSTLAGVFFDQTGSYALALQLLAAGSVLAVVLMATLGKPAGHYGH
jgi:MFS family permease